MSSLRTNALFADQAYVRSGTSTVPRSAAMRAAEIAAAKSQLQSWLEQLATRMGATMGAYLHTQLAAPYPKSLQRDSEI